jgi:hypothetical protein
MAERTEATAEPIPHWIPRDIFLPSKNCSVSSGFSSSSKEQLSPNEDSAVHSLVTDREDNEDSSSIWSLSTTSDLTYHSYGATSAPAPAVRPPLRTLKSTDRTDIRQAVEAAYNDLEHEHGGSEPWLSAQAIPESHETMLVYPAECYTETQIADEEEEEEEEPLFDPFLLHSEADNSIFTDYYSQVDKDVTANNIQDDALLSNFPSDFSQAMAAHSTSSPTNSVVYKDEETADPPPTLSTRSNSCTPSPRRRMMRRMQRHHSDLTAPTSSSSRRKRRVFVPLHARMEMIQHQSQKPLRTVSRAIFGSVQKIHDCVVGTARIERSNRLLKSSNSPRSRMNVFRRRGKVSTGYQCEEASAVSSLPELQNIDSEETGRTLPLEYSQTTALDGDDSEQQEEELVHPIQFLVEDAQARTPVFAPAMPTATSSPESKTSLPPRPPLPPPLTTVLFAPTSQNEDGDLRWLFARQQLPLTTPMHVRAGQPTEEIPEEMGREGRTLIDI